MDAAPFIDPETVRRHVDSGSFARGVDYHRSGMVRDVRWDAATGTVRAVVQGTERTPYRCVVRVAPTAAHPIVDAACSCPLGGDCKHTVAALLASNDDAVQARGESVAARPATWREALRGPTTGGAGTAPLALGVELRRRSPANRSWWAPRTVEPVAPGDLLRPDGRGDLVVGFRPLTRGASGKWIKGDASWDVVRRPGSPFPAAQARWLADLHALTRDQRTLGQLADGSEWLTLDSATSSLLWPHLRGAAQAGIPIVATRRHTRISLADTAEFRIEVAGSAGGDLLVTPRVTVDGRGVEPSHVHALGRAVAAHIHGDGDTIAIVLAPLALDEVAQGLLRGDAVRVPSADADEFFRDDRPRLARTHEVVAAAGYALPPLAAPHLQVRVAFTAVDRASVALRWTYPGAGAFPFGSDAVGDRDAEVEEGIARELLIAWPATVDPRAVVELRDADAAEFAVHILPKLSLIDGVLVETSGERPAYRELTGDPHITVSTVESDDPDWFDLGVVVTIDGTRIPFTPLFTALSQRRTTLLMVDGSYFSLAHPALDRLRELVDEAATLTEWETGPRITRYQAPLWADFEDLADVAEPAVSWRTAADALRSAAGVAPVPAPAGLRAQLRPYQQAGLDHLAFLWKHRLGGILADDMGLGKTLQILALLLHARSHGEQRPFLIVAPTSVTTTWRSEAERFAPGLRVRVVDRTGQARGSRLADDAADADVIVTSYAVLRLDADEFQSFTWGALVLDEAQMVKNPRTQLYRAVRDLRAGITFAVTGTPLENRLDELWTLLSLSSPGLFPSARRFREEYVKPIEQGKVPENAEGAPYRAARLERLRRRIRPFLLRRTKELVAPELPPKQEQVLRIDLSPAHRAAYDAVLQRERQKVLGLLADLDRNRFIVFRSLTLLRLLSLSPALVDAGDARIRSSKLDTLLDMLEEIAAEGRRTLVFSQFTSYLALAAAELDIRGIPYVQLDGSTRNRAGVVDAFRRDEAAVFLISLRAGGFGLTLTEADHVFLLDPWWNPAVEAQAVDRAHRIGQTRPVNVYRLVAAGTIEEKVMALQERKARLFDAVLDDEALFAQALSADDIRHLFDG